VRQGGARQTDQNGFMSAVSILMALLALCNSAWAAGAPPETLLEQYRCTICHAERVVGAGPAWVDIAVRYRGKPHAVKIVAGRIRSGVRDGGPWHMPPHPEVSKADALTMARYILSVRN
jgi:cytochrome c